MAKGKYTTLEKIEKEGLIKSAMGKFECVLANVNDVANGVKEIRIYNETEIKGLKLGKGEYVAFIRYS